MLLDVIQPSFAAGEVTEALQSREDLAKQQVAVKTLRNAIVTSTGSIVNRGGLKMVAEVYDSTYKSRLIPFVFSTEQAYAQELSEKIMRVVKDGALVLIDLVDSAYKWTASGSGTSEYYLELSGGGDPGLAETDILFQDGSEMSPGTAGALFAGQWDYDDNDTLGYNTFYVRLTDNADPNSKAQGYIQIPVEVVTPYSAGAENSALDYAQSADVMYLVTPDYTPYKITRTSDTAWTITEIAFQDGPYLPFIDGDDDVTLTPAAKTGSGIVVEVSEAITWPEVGLSVRIGYVNPLDTSIIEWGWGTIAVVTDTDTFTLNIEKDLGYEYLLNPEFKDGIGFWDDRSSGASSITFDSANQSLVLNKGASGEAFAEQPLTVAPYERLTFEITVDVVDTQLQVYIGTTSGGTDILATQNIAAPGSYSYTTAVNEPNISTAFVTFGTIGAPGPSTHKVSITSLMRKDLATQHHRKGAFSATLGWPEHVAIFEQALLLGNNINQPDTFWKTKTGEYETYTFHTPLLDTDGVSQTLASNQVNAIQWMEPFLELVCGTTGEEWKVQAGPNTSTITPTSITAKPKSKTGSASVKPIIAGNSLLFLNRNSNKVYVLTYSFDADGYKPSDITVLAPHLLSGHTITEWAYQEDPNSVIWAIRDDGVLLGLTYIEEQEIWAWSTHDTLQGKFESVCVVPEDGVDTVYFIVKRILYIGDGVPTKRYIEKLMPRIEDEDIYDWYMVDSGVSVDIANDISGEAAFDSITLTTTVEIVTSVATGTLADDDYVYISGVVGTTELNGNTYRISDLGPSGGDTSFKLKDKEGDAYINGSNFGKYVSGGELRRGITAITGLEHLAVRDVAILADGSAYTDTVGAGGTLTLDPAAIVVHIGLPITTDIETLPHEMILSATATTQGNDKKLTEVVLQVHKSRYALVGPDVDNLVEMNFNDEDSGNNPTALFTGTKKELVDDVASLSTQTFIRNDKPIPLELTGIVSKVDFNEP